MNNFWIAFGWLTVVGIGALCIAWIAAKVSDSVDIRKHRGAFAALAAALAIFAGAKHGAPTLPVVEKPKWMMVTSTVNTNDYLSAWIEWRSSYNVPDDTMLTIYLARGGQATTNWNVAAYSYWQDRSNEVYVAEDNITNYLAKVECLYEPGDIRVSDFKAFASRTNMSVTCSWTCPTNAVGWTADIEYRMKQGEPSYWTLLKRVTVQTNNSVKVSGNYVSRGLDREFRVVLYGFSNAFGVRIPLDTVVYFKDRTPEDMFWHALRKRYFNLKWRDYFIEIRKPLLPDYMEGMKL